MQLNFFKYQGTGNDFILLDNRTQEYNLINQKQIEQICNRHFGIGADGLMLLNASTQYDFEMKYYNSDGNESTMCGNGGRCIVAFAKSLGIVATKANFSAIDGAHSATISNEDYIELKMNDVSTIIVKETYHELNTGSPHYVHYIDDVRDLDVRKEGALIRYSPLYKEEGINVNFVEILNDQTLFVRTYERGVEDETLSCGTGVTAAALSFCRDKFGPQETTVRTLGGELHVSCNNIDGQHFNAIWLSGKATFVFQGTIDL